MCEQYELRPLLSEWQSAILRGVCRLRHNPLAHCANAEMALSDSGEPRIQYLREADGNRRNAVDPVIVSRLGF